MTRRRWLTIRQLAVAAATAAVTAGAAAGCGAQHGVASTPSPVRTTPPPVPAPLGPIADYRKAVTVALRDHLRVWIEADMVKRWEEGPKWFHVAVARVSALANRPGVIGIKIADELGYNDGMDSSAEIRRFLTETARDLRASAPHKLILVDMVLPQLGCIPGHQPAGSAEAGCAAAAQSAYPQLALPAVDGYLRLHAIDVLDLSTGLLSDGTYTSWGTTSDEAQTAAWQEVDRRGWPGLVQLQARKALAHPGSYSGTGAEAAADVHLFVDIPLANGAKAVDIWTWNQMYNGALYHLMNPGMRTNALWKQLQQRRRAGDVLFTHMSPHSVEVGLRSDLAMIATVFTDIFLPAGTG
ncbi:MAG TPA: hypothetical protein VN840_02415 [Streptosporangiaceae bacterium]|nr:hypothetical protein [Streptosporangiaceae bacterium]